MNRHITLLLLFALVVALPSTASADLLVHEPFDYAEGWLTTEAGGPQGGALGTTGTWTAHDTTGLNYGDFGGTPQGDWRVHQEGNASGIVVDPGPPAIFNTFDGTVANLTTSGGYAGLPGPADVGAPADLDFEIGRYQDASIALGS